MLEVRNIYKTYEGKPLLKGVSFQIRDGETLGLLGPSGSGKSTLLRIIAGLESAESGEVLWDGQDLAGVPVHQRGFGLMFQDYALFPHRSVAENIAFGLRMQNLPRADIDSRVKASLEQIGLSGFGSRRVTDLSGGEQQRVALARALAPQPRLLMLDEPLGALDRRLREQLLDELHHLLKTTHVSAIYVTHDQEEAFTLADRIVLLRDGCVAQEGSPAEIYAAPNSIWVAGFFGLSNRLAGQVDSENPFTVETSLGHFSAIPTSGFLPHTGQQVALLLRSEGIRLVSPDDPDAQLSGLVEDAPFRGGGFRLEIRLGSDTLFTLPVERPVPPGERIGLILPPTSWVAYPPE